MSSPIADLSYRNYDGPIEAPRHRWWAIAKMSVRMVIARRGYWWAMLASGWYYLAMIFTLFVVDQLMGAAPQRPGAPAPSQQFLDRLVWKDQFLHGFSYGQLMMLMVALMVGAGAIANDNRANALLVYLSKPCTKLDYLIGKWFGVFVPLIAVVIVPGTFFFLYAAMSYRDQGFFSDPWIYPKFVFGCIAAAGFQASLVMGVSSFFNQGRVAGATYAGIYFLSNFFTQLMVIGFVQTSRGRGASEELSTISKLLYSSIDGQSIGAMKAILGTDGSPFFNLPTRQPMPPAPPGWLMATVMITVSLICLGMAWKRIRAVEVVG